MVFVTNTAVQIHLTDEYDYNHPITRIEHLRDFEQRWKEINGYAVTVIDYKLLRTEGGT